MAGDPAGGAPRPRLRLADVQRVDFGDIRTPDDWPGGAGQALPVHGFVIRHPLGAILVDTGVGDPAAREFVREWRPVARRVADALAPLGLAPVDVRWVINTHLHWDHCGQNAVFAHAPFVVQRREYETAATRDGVIMEWFEVSGARFELVDGVAEVVAGVRVVPTPGHTIGHQAVVVATDVGDLVLAGDAADSIRAYRDADPSDGAEPEDLDQWRASIAALQALRPARVRVCHDPAEWRAG
ncbi:MAG TPA: N-acyl homoserine lactonase family protein [Candidatus Dormibacteraeota bacterium]|nr:N-acyl homoserine lactonase family protein [Candidatus Dormibacteraeota bacterium]